MVFGRKKEAPPSRAPPPAPPPAAPTARELTRQNDRTIARAQRDLQRERLRLEADEKKIINEMKALGRQGRVTEARMLAKNLVQVRNAKARTFQAGAQAGAIGTQARMAQADAKMMGIMGTTVGVMRNANNIANPEGNMQMLQEFDAQTQRYQLNQEMTDEVLDSVLGGAEVDGETDDVLNSVLDEIGFEVGSRVGATPSIQPQSVPEQERLQAADDVELESRIAKLGGGL